MSFFSKRLHLLPTLVPAVATAVVVALVATGAKPVATIGVFVGMACAAAIVRVDAGKSFQIYTAYLLFEGALKIFSNYNPVVHVGSDLLLLLMFLRLINRRASLLPLSKQPVPTAAAESLVPYLLVFWIWVAVQFFNPWGLGLLPSLASLKLYLIPMLVYFAATYLLHEDELEKVPLFIVGLGLFEAVCSTIDGSLGDSYLPHLHPRYQMAMSDRFVGVLYRPFGTTSQPGAPATWMTHCLIATLIVLRKTSQQVLTAAQRKLRYWLCGLFFPFAIATLILCQGRTMLIRFGLLTVIGGLSSGSRRAVASVLIAAMFTVIAFPVLDQVARSGIMDPKDAVRVLQITNRFTSLGNKSTWEDARDGAVEGMLRLSEQTSLGIGLSRVGAASSQWSAIIQADPVFDSTWSFADNLYRCLFTELGIFGLGAYLLLMAAVFFKCLARGTFEGRMVAANVGVFMLAGVATEGILYQPDTAFFWLYAGIALRSRKPAEVPA